VQVPKIDVQHQTLAALLAQMESGQLQVPRFQRDFVWPVSKTRALLDSMYKEFPIGTFFLWRVPPEASSLFRPLTALGIPEPPAGAPIALILDGQQRLTSLYVTTRGLRLGGRDYGSICIDLEKGAEYLANTDEGYEEDIFVYRTPDNEQFVAVRDLVATDHLAIYDKIQPAWKPAFMRAHQILQTYPFSVVWIQEQSLSDAITIFQRINQAGKRLSRYDLVCANVWTEDFDFRKRVEQVNRQFARSGFGALDETVFTQAFALILRDRCTTAAELSLKTEEIVEAWDRVVRSLRLAVDFAFSNLGVKRADFLPYRGMLVVLAYYFYHARTSALSAKQREALWRWFWRVTLSERYGSTSPSRMAEDAQKMKALIEGESVTFDYRYTISAEALRGTRMTTTSSALRNGVLCMLALKEPRNLKDGSLVNLGDEFFSDLRKAERHHIFPVGHLKRVGVGSTAVHQVPNFCFIPADLNREIGSRPPAEYMAELRRDNPHFDAVAASHLIPVSDDSPIWSNDFQGFSELRAQLMADELNEMATGSPESLIVVPMPKDPVAEKVDELETRLRDFIDHRLTAVMGTRYWKQAVPGDVVDKVRQRIDKQLQQQPYETQAKYASGRSRLDFCDVPDYEKIILVNWQQFQDLFQSKGNVQKHLGAYGELRNAVQHNRPPTEVELGLGQVAIKWLNSVLDAYDAQQEESAEEEPALESVAT